MKNFVQEGDALTLAAPYDVTSGSGALVGSIFGVAVHDALSGADVTLELEGVYSLKKTSAQAWTVGAKIYWDNTAKECTATVASNTLIGVAVEAAANSSSMGKVRLGIVA
jgi:predicted RecA/RadA family phage recombinase